MNTIIKNIIYACGVVGILSYCGVDPIGDSGGASETVAIVVSGSTMYGKASKLSEDNIESANPDVMVTLFKVDYLPFPFLETNVNNITNKTSSDIHGAFQFTDVKTGYYNIYVKDAITGKAAFFDSIAVSPGRDDTIYDSLAWPGSIEGYVTIISTDNDTTNAAGYDVYIPGSHFATVTESNGAYSLDSLPVGKYNILSMSVSNLVMDTTWTDNLDSLMAYINSAHGKTVSVESEDTFVGVDIYLQQ